MVAADSFKSSKAFRRSPAAFTAIGTVLLLSLVVFVSFAVPSFAEPTQTCDVNPNQPGCLQPCPEGYERIYGSEYCIPGRGLLDIFGNAMDVVVQWGGAIAATAGEKIVGIFSVNTIYKIMSAAGISKGEYDNACSAGGTSWFITFTAIQALIVTAFLAVAFWLMFLKEQGKMDPKEEMDPKNLFKKLGSKKTKKAAWSFLQGCEFGESVGRLLYPGLPKGFIKNISRKGVRKYRFRAAWDAVDGKVMGAVAAGAGRGVMEEQFGQIDQTYKDTMKESRQSLVQNLGADAAMGHAGIPMAAMHGAEYMKDSKSQKDSKNQAKGQAADETFESMGSDYKLAIIEGAALDALDAVMSATHALAIGALFLILYGFSQWFPSDCFNLNYKFIASLVWAYWVWEILRVIVTRSSFMLAMWIPRGLLKVVFIPFSGAGSTWIGRIFQIFGMVWLMGRFHPAQYSGWEIWVGLCWAMFLHVLLLITAIGIAAILVQGTRPIILIVRIFVKVLSKIFGMFTALIYGNQSKQVEKMKAKFGKLMQGLERGGKRMEAVAESARKSSARIQQGLKPVKSMDDTPLHYDPAKFKEAAVGGASNQRNIEFTQQIQGMYGAGQEIEKAGSKAAEAGQWTEEKTGQAQQFFQDTFGKPKPPKK